MTNPVLELKEITTKVNQGTNRELTILKNISLKVNKGDYITIIGTNGSGKSTLFNVISGLMQVSVGKIYLNGKDITNLKEENRSKFLSRVFQDPKLGTAPRMTVAENLLLALKRGEKRNFLPRNLKNYFPQFIQLTKSMHNGLENRLNAPTEVLSGGQRQALSFLMAIIKKPDILLLDEHTAALDPKTSATLMNETDNQISRGHLTALMITHKLEDALKFGNYLLILNQGKIKFIFGKEEKKRLTVNELEKFLI